MKVPQQKNSKRTSQIHHCVILKVYGRISHCEKLSYEELVDSPFIN